MTQKTIKTLIFLSILGAWSSASACGPKIKKKQVHQKHQIEKGVRTGKLDRRELRKLKREQKKVIRLKKQALLDDGNIDNREARKIARLQREQSRRLKKFKNTSR